MSRPSTNIGDDYMQAMMETDAPRTVKVGSIIQITRWHLTWPCCLFQVNEVLDHEVRASHRFQDCVAYVLFNDKQYTVVGEVRWP